MKYVVDIILIVLLIILIKAIYSIGDIFLSTASPDKISDTTTAYYKCGRNKKTDLYCRIKIKGE